ncbi:MAG: glycosyltransferase family 2 protein [Dehalococcoidia bacterium]|nr:glycosyltransferase family 2 protein [Dehalococcoidia bacterium]
MLNNAEFDLEAVQREVAGIPNVQVIHIEGRTTLGDCLNRGVEAASGEYVAKMDDDDLYGEHYISDSVLAASFSGAEVVGKGIYFVYFESLDRMALRENSPEHTFTSSTVAGSTMFIQTEVVRDIPFGSTSVGEDTRLQRSAVRAGCQVYSTDRFNYVCTRIDQSSNHSWQIQDAEFRTKCRDYTSGLDLSRTMI